MKSRPMPVPNEVDVDRALWYFATKFLPADYAKVPFYSKPPSPQYGGGLPLPPGIDPPHRLLVPTHQPQWIDPNFWTIPFERSAEVCALYYKTWYTVFSEEIGSTKMAVLDRVSYEIANLPQYEVFEVEIIRSGIQLARWEDMQLDPAATNPAERVALGGHYRPVPTYARIDHDERLTVRVRMLGPEDASGVFPRTDADIADVAVKVVLGGWQPSVMDTRTSAKRPIDPMHPYDNYGRPMMDPTNLQHAQELLQWWSLWPSY